MQQGWIKIHRKIMDSEWYFKEKFTKIQAWIDLLLQAEINPKTIYIRGQRIELQRGQISTSIRTLAERWKWSPNTVRKFLADTLADTAIDTQTDTLNTIITICNFDKYQTIQNNSDTLTDTRTDTDIDTLNEKKIETEKEKGSPHTPLLKEKEKEKEKGLEEEKNILTHTITHAHTREENFFNELLSAQIYIEQMAMRFHITTDYVTDALREFRKENELKDTPHYSLRDYKSHFHDWLRYQVEKKSKQNDNGDDYRRAQQSNREQRARETEAAIDALLRAGARRT